MTGPLCILALNPGSTSTRIALFRDESVALEVELRHGPDEWAAGSSDDLHARLEHALLVFK